MKTAPITDRTTLLDVANYCDLSRATVSRVLNGNAGKFRIAAETITKVEKAAKTLNYRPNRLARAIQSRRTYLIGLSLPQYTADNFSDEALFANEHRVMGLIFSTIQQHPAFDKYDLVVHNRKERTEDQNTLKSDLLDGLIYTTPAPQHLEFLENANRDIPVVVMGDDPSLNNKLICVDMNNREMAKTATRHLLSLGKKNILLLIPESVESVDCIQSRTEGYRDALAEAGLPVNPDLTRILRCKQDLVTHYIETSDTFKNIDAIFGLTDEIAAMCIEPLKERGFRIPEDIAVMGFTGSQLFSQTNPPLSTVKTPFGQMAYQAAEKLMEVLEGKKPYTPGFYEVPSELVIQESTVKS